MLRLCIFFINFFLCLNLGWGQTSVPTQTSTPPYYPYYGPPPTITTSSPTLPSPNDPPPKPAAPAGSGSAPAAGAGAASAAPGGAITTPAPSTGAAGVGTSTPTTVGSPAANDALMSMVGSVSTPAGKYEEYQSICRNNLYDKVAYADTETQKKRVEDLKLKIADSKTPVIFKIRLLKEYIDQRRSADFESYYSKLKEEKFSEEEGKTVDALFSYYRGDMKRAESTLSGILQENRKNRVALEFLAEIYKADTNYFEAAAAYLDLSKLTKEDVDLELCEIQTLDSQHKDAEKSCKRAAQKLENNPYPLIYLGISQRELMNFEQSARYFKDSIKRKQTEMGYSCLAELFFIKEKYTGASEFFKRALDVFPNSSRALLGLAWAQLKDKKLPESLESFKNACNKDRRIRSEIRKAFKILTEEKSSSARQFADLAQRCTD
jgi:thioredoxin-like negative regulator of GroEL